MEAIKFSIEYDDGIDDIVFKITEAIREVGYNIDFDGDAEERDDGVVEYVLTKLEP